MEINILELVVDVNNKDISKKQIIDKYGITEYAYKKLLKQNGYTYNSKLGQWVLVSDDVDIETTKVTYRIPKELYTAIKIQSAFEGITSTELIIKALEKYIPKTTMEIMKQNKK